MPAIIADIADGSIWLGSMPDAIICCMKACISGGKPSIPGTAAILLAAAPPAAPPAAGAPGIPGMDMPGMPPIIIMLFRSSIIFLLFWATMSWLYSPRSASCFAAYNAQVNSSKP